MDLDKLAKDLFRVFNCTKTKTVYDNNIRWTGVARYVALMVLDAQKQSLEAIRKDLDPYFEATTLYRKVDNKLDHDIKELDQEIAKVNKNEQF